MRSDASVIQMILHAVADAEEMHPNWPEDTVHAAAIVAEEAGELVRAALIDWYEEPHEKEMLNEALHTAATAFRFIKNHRGARHD